MTDVIVVGAGPVGTLLAAELVRFGVTTALLERRTESGAGTRAIGLHSPVLAALEPSGITERLLAGAQRIPRGEARAGDRMLGVVRFDRLSTRFPFVAALPQSATEAALAAGAPQALRGATVTAVTPGRADVRVRYTIGGGLRELRAPIVVLAGGWASRPLAYRTLPVRIYADRYLMADIPVGDRHDADVAVVNLTPGGVLESFPLPGGMRRMVAWDRIATPVGSTPAARADRLRRALAARGEAAAADAVTEATEFGVRRVVAPAMRRGRLFVIGDAAHEVSPIGGQGMNLGLLDAVTLAPLLAGWAATGIHPESQLAEWERRRVSSATRAARLAAINTALGRPRGPAADAARRGLVRAMLAPPLGRGFASAYAMGLDADA